LERFTNFLYFKTCLFQNLNLNFF
jgi:histone arginine demethylase JMJD6